MRISEIHVYSKNLHIVGGPYTMAGTELHEVTTTIVKVVADNGLIGWGESCPLGAAYQAEHALGVQAALAQFAPDLIGEPVMPSLQLQRRMQGLLCGHQSSKSAIDIAAIDLRAKQLGVSVSQLLGVSNVEKIPSYYALGLGSPAETASLALEKVDQGYPRLQLKIGGRDIDTDAETIRKVWEVVGGRVQLVADANRGLTMLDAIRLCNLCANIPFVLEQPCDTMAEVAAVRKVVKQGIFLDENTLGLDDILQASSENICQGFGLKLGRLGGLSAFVKARDICEARNLPITCDDSFGGDIIAAACVHGGASVRSDLFAGTWIAAPYLERHYDPVAGPEVEHGYIRLPTGPGLGVSPEEERIGDLIASYA